MKENYSINENTLALIPARNIDYQTIVAEKTRKLYIRKTPLEIVKTACYQQWYTYEGRREAVMRHTNFRRKVPIPINHQKGIYLFPTDSPKSFENVWISYKHIATTKALANGKSAVIFYNGLQLTLNISHYILRKQMNRTFECMYRMGAMPWGTSIV